MITTTLNEIRRFGPCKPGWEKLLNHLGKTKADNEPLPLLTVLDSNGLDDAIWCLRVAPEVSAVFARWCAELAAERAELAGWAELAASWAERAKDAAWAAARTEDAELAAGWAERAASCAGGREAQTEKLRELLS